jgi:SAM-dependent methyltransferase
MAQITNGVRSVLSHPLVYSAFQSLMGAHRSRTRFVQEFVRPFPGMKVLDVGCGPADILAYLPGVDYWGFDISPEYIARAQVRFGSRGRFASRLLLASDLVALPAFDVVLAMGVLHHLDDAVAGQVIQLAHHALAAGGRLLTIDPCLDPSQNPVARFLIRRDRGQNVRDRAGYAALAQSAFRQPRVEVRHTLWIPYTHCFLECCK